MKQYRLRTVHLGKLYVYNLTFLLFGLTLMLGSIKLIVCVFPHFDQVSSFILLFSLVFAFFSFNIVFKKSSRIIEVSVNNFLININEDEISFKNIHTIKCSNTFLLYYPKVVFTLKTGQKMIYRFDKEFDYQDFIFDLRKKHKF
jgi:hypothetical protein